ncbi:MAG: UDP-N-acetylglucosamine 2-epimerase (non-hydrolyzing) [Bacillota bacterium]|nr:UDP-N-acetylglucosamine 2-epimerase (non-hydrolyzing) [Bacillota bacterium]
MTRKVMLVFGTRPEATKMAPVFMALRQSPFLEPVLCVSAQHREMLDLVLDHFGIVPDYDLDVMTPRQSLSMIATRVMEGLDEILVALPPDLLLVHGDTTTTMAAAIAAFHRAIPVGHVEAGLRTGDKMQPYPEEVNRRVADAVCDLHFAPTQVSKRNLLREGISPSGIFVTGNTAVDALLWTVRPDYVFHDQALRRVDWGAPEKIVAVEVHRRENWGEPMRRVGSALRRVATSLPVRLVVSVHKNPEVREAIPPYLEGLPNVMLHEPFEYPDWANLMKRARLVITDSGGLQEEAPSLGRPVLVCREKTERPEAVEAGTVRLVGTDEDAIFETTRELLEDGALWKAMSQAKNPYGDGDAAVRTIQAIEHYFGFRKTRPQDFGEI